MSLFVGPSQCCGFVVADFRFPQTRVVPFMLCLFVFRLPFYTCTFLCLQYHKNLFPDKQVPGFGAAYTSLWEALRERVALPMMAALEEMLCLPRGEELQ